MKMRAVSYILSSNQMKLDTDFPTAMWLCRHVTTHRQVSLVARQIGQALVDLRLHAFPSVKKDASVRPIATRGELRN